MNKSNYTSPCLIDLGFAIDDRGFLTFFNSLSDFDIKRFYIINNNQDNFIRAWHAHKNESKIFLCLDGSLQISLVKLDSFKKPSKNLKIENFFLEKSLNKILFIPGGYANGIKFFNYFSRVLVFSSSTLDESLNDDFRFKYDYWNPWNTNYR